MSNFPILVQTQLIFPIPWAPAPFQKTGVRALKLSETPAPFDSSLLPVMALLKYRFKPQLHNLHIHDSLRLMKVLLR